MGSKLYIYKSQSYSKPLCVVTLNSSLTIIDIRKADVGGKEFVMCLNGEHYFKASTQSLYDKWVSSFKYMRQMFQEK